MTNNRLLERERNTRKDYKSMRQQIERYLELKEKMKEYQKEPIGNRIKPGGKLEARIKQVFRPERVEKILTRTKNNYEEWEKAKGEYYNLKKELEDKEIIAYNEYDEEIILDID